MKLHFSYLAVPIAQFRLPLAVGLAVALLASGLKAQTNDLSAGFSPTSNPNGPWAYGWSESVGGAFTALTVPWVSTADGGEQVPSWQLTSFQIPAVYKNTSGNTITVGGGAASIPPETVWFYPGEDFEPQNFGVIRFTVPTGQSGTYLVQAQVNPIYPSFPQGDTDFHVAQNGTEVFGRFLAPSESTSFTADLVLAEGDRVEFVIGRGADGSSFGSGLRIAATLTLTAAGPPSPPPHPTQVAYVLSDGFSAASNPNGAWAYGWAGTVGGAFTALTVPWLSTADGGQQVPSWQLTSFQTPAVYKNTSGTTITVGGGAASLPPGTVWYYPGEDGRPENFGVIRFSVPAGKAGPYRVEADVSPVYPSSPQGDTDFHITRNTTEVFGRFLAPSASATFNRVFMLHEGDFIDFAIGRGADGLQFGSGLRISATLTALAAETP